MKTMKKTKNNGSHRNIARNPVSARNRVSGSHPFRNSNRQTKTVMVRDLMKSVFIFGFRDQPIQFVTELRAALDKFDAGERFYLYPGGDTLYRVDPVF